MENESWKSCELPTTIFSVGTKVRLTPLGAYCYNNDIIEEGTVAKHLEYGVWLDVPSGFVFVEFAKDKEYIIDISPTLDN